MTKINIRIALHVLLGFVVVHGREAKGLVIANLTAQLCAQGHQRRLDAVTCIGTQTKTEFPSNLAKCVRSSFKAQAQLKDFGLGTLCAAPLAAEGLASAAPHLWMFGRASGTSKPLAINAMACALSYSAVKLSQVKGLAERCLIRDS